MNRVSEWGSGFQGQEPESEKIGVSTKAYTVFFAKLSSSLLRDML